MSDFYAWFDGMRAAARASDDGKVFAASNFDIAHTGGSCTAWSRDIDDTGWCVIITCSEGCSHELYDADDCWFVGVASNVEGDFINGEEAQSIEDALVMADKLHEKITSGDFTLSE